MENPIILRSEYSFRLLVKLMKLLLWGVDNIMSQSWRQSARGVLVIRMPHEDRCLMFCFIRSLDPAVRQDRPEPTVAISRNSLNVLTPMGIRRALAEAAMEPVGRSQLAVKTTLVLVVVETTNAHKPKFALKR